MALSQGAKSLVIGERGKHDPFVLAPCLFVAQRDRCRQRSVEESLPQLARDDGLPIAAAQKGNRFDM
jgi:hypothetical protein